MIGSAPQVSFQKSSRGLHAFNLSILHSGECTRRISLRQLLARYAVPVSLRNERDEMMRCAVSNANCGLEELKRSKKHRVA